MEPIQSVSPSSHTTNSYQRPTSPPLSPSHPRTLPADSGLPSLPLLPAQHINMSSSQTSQEGTPVPPPTASTSSLPPPLAGPSSTTAAGLPPPQMHHFIPDNPDGGSDDEDDEDDDSGRPKKKVKKGAAAGRGAAGAGGNGTGGEDDKEKGRRKIEIEYIQKKEKRHITFSKRKAGIMKKVSAFLLARALEARRRICSIAPRPSAGDQARGTGKLTCGVLSYYRPTNWQL